MSLIARKPRPIESRDKDAGSLRDDRLFIVACDDTHAPQQYFNFFRFTRVRIHVVPTSDGTSAAKHVLRRLLEFEHEDYDERWMLLDSDHVTQGSHIKGTVRALQDARDQGVKVAISKPCFELWLLLHYVEEANVIDLDNAHATELALRARLGEYNKTGLKRAHYPYSAVAAACQRAARLDAIVEGGDIPSSNTTRVYRLWKDIAASALPNLFPHELRFLVEAGSRVAHS